MNECLMVDVSNTIVVKKPFVKQVTASVREKEGCKSTRECLADLSLLPAESIAISGLLSQFGAVCERFRGNIWVVTKCDSPQEEEAKLLLLKLIGFWKLAGLNPSERFVAVQTRRDKLRFIEDKKVTHVVDDHGELHRMIVLRKLNLMPIWFNSDKYFDLYPDLRQNDSVLKIANWFGVRSLLCGV